jgi:hypothetical protein
MVHQAGSPHPLCLKAGETPPYRTLSASPGLNLRWAARALGLWVIGYGAMHRDSVLGPPLAHGAGAQVYYPVRHS